MSKGAGGGGRGSGSADAKRAIGRFLRVGLRGRDITGGLPMRESSLAHLRGKGGASSALPVTVTIYPGGTHRVTDGRHRITVARERGQSTIVGKIQVMGPRGGYRGSFTGKIRI